jgi:hypothetical protein
MAIEHNDLPGTEACQHLGNEIRPLFDP